MEIYLRKNGLVTLVKCPPLLDWSYFVQWKNTTKNLFGIEHPQLWQIVEKGPLEITKQNRDEWDDEDYDKCRKNARALHILYCALSSNDFYRVATCKTAKQVWDALTLAYEGADYQSVLLASEFRKASLQETGFEPREMEKGCSTKRPPLLVDESHFQKWKARMRAYIESRDPQLWHIIEDGELKLTKVDNNGLEVEKCSDEWDENDYTKLTKNARAIWELSIGLPYHVYDAMMSKMETAKTLWKALNDRYECSESLKQIKISSLERELELLEMSEGESIKEMFNRFVTIIGKLALLGEQVSMPAQVRKIMRSLPYKDEYRVFIINTEFSNDWAKMSLDELFYKLWAFEVRHGLMKSRRNR